jgi:hypothetical protein
MVSERPDLEQGHEDAISEHEPIDGDGFVMTDPEPETEAAPGDELEEINPEASSYGSP